MIPKNKPSHPGVFIREFILNEFNMNQKQLATHLGVSWRTINQLVNGKKKVTADIALRLGKFTNTNPQVWTNLQTTLELWEASHRVTNSPIELIKSHIQPTLPLKSQ